MKYVPVGSQVYVYVTQNVDIKANLEQIFADIASAGYEGIELFASTLEAEQDAERVRALSEKLKLPVTGAYLSVPLWDKMKRTSIVEASETACRRIRYLGGSVLILGNRHKQEPMTPDEYTAQAKTLNDCAAIAAPHEIRLAYHTYPPDVQDDERVLNGIFGQVTEKLVLAADLDWIARGGVNPEDFLRRWKKKVGHLHLRDSFAGRWVEAIGEGEVDYRSLREVLDEIEYEDWVIAELAYEKGAQATRPIRESLKLSRDHIREAMGF